jgi:hypothetical protein
MEKSNLLQLVPIMALEEVLMKGLMANHESLLQDKRS